MKIAPQTSLAWLLALIFLYAGIIKAANPSSFYHDIRMYHLLSDRSAWLCAHYLPWLEIVVGIGLIWPDNRGSASSIAAVLLSIFILALTSAWKRGLDIDCGCFGAARGSGSHIWVLVRDLVMLSVSIYLLNAALSRHGKPETTVTKET